MLLSYAQKSIVTCYNPLPILQIPSFFNQLSHGSYKKAVFVEVLLQTYREDILKIKNYESWK